MRGSAARRVHRRREWRCGFKYVSKEVAEGREVGRHRYEVAQGFTPKPIYVEGESADDVIAQASRFMGRQPTHVWHSSREDGWQGPPACWVAWA